MAAHKAQAEKQLWPLVKTQTDVQSSSPQKRPGKSPFLRGSGWVPGASPAPLREPNPALGRGTRETEAQRYTGLTFPAGSSELMSMPGTQGCSVPCPHCLGKAPQGSPHAQAAAGDGDFLLLGLHPHPRQSSRGCLLGVLTAEAQPTRHLCSQIAKEG